VAVDSCDSPSSDLHSSDHLGIPRRGLQWKQKANPLLLHLEVQRMMELLQN